MKKAIHSWLTQITVHLVVVYDTVSKDDSQ